MKLLVVPLYWLYKLYAAVTFVALMLVVFVFSLPAVFMGRIKGGNWVYRLCVLWGDVWFPMVFIFHKNIYEQKPETDKQYIYVANHISFLDAALIMCTIRQPMRPLAKVEYEKMPVFGFIYKMAIVSVDRSSAEKRASSVRILKSVLNKGISIFFFPEGTFNETGKPLKSFFDGAFRIAIETQTPIKPILFLDSYNRLNYKGFFSLTPGRNRSVFLQEIETKGLVLKDVAFLKEKVFDAMEQKLVAYKAPWIKD